ncbi:MAG: TetR/AcrR family transcriptional regulator [Rubrobacter sp.]|nr:TetR/AcrR family transcriptional regulator [Rubrobacter sp.]
MPRPAKFTEGQILDAALRLVAEGGPGAATIAGIAGLLGAPVGSIYHRFTSRDFLLARLWIRTIKGFQKGFIEALEADDLDEAAFGAALYNVDWTREHLQEARVLLLYRREELAERWPEELGEELATINADVEAAVMNHAIRRYGKEVDAAALRRVVFALVDVPYAVGRRHLINGEPPPPLANELVTETLWCVLIGGTSSGT